MDIAFGDVLAVGLPIALDGVTLEKADSQFIRTIAPQLGSSLDLDNLIVIRGRDYRGYVVASIVEIDESDRFLWEPDKWGICAD
ncbi:hypothetical protein [Streptosporangium subroseum]|uniref:hypothetical protein n=1 Tax=Streptosporangium subroseum TaxID=106412 RepID=UPI000B784CE9|nr:hypothetical protein [Streptosporangium subroseum]